MDLKSLPLSRLQSNLTCSICQGYLIDATTITECMHTCEYYTEHVVVEAPP
ncbi:putative Polycomb group RING finger protein 3 [Daphnia magna]|uniref:Putative Polycomb group RING finger protein 3 n=1 Tax=Daphnia magna TaxID=35525 RepID=A0A162CUJ5_9CRUS|nr:putative Polycomb group RING finger protein 3 [Daphnia magna]